MKQLILPVLLLTFSLAVFSKTPKDNFFNPRPLNYKSNFENFYNRDLPYVTVSVPRLTYSGLDYVVDGRVQGHYYYTLSDGLCQFYVLSREGQTPPAAALESINLKGRLIQLDDIEYGAIIKNMAGQLGWTAASLRNMSASCAVTTVPHPVYLGFLFWAVLYGCLFLSAADLLCTIFYLLQPLRSPAFRGLGSYGKVCALLPKVELEMKHVNVAKAGGIYLTPSYIVDTDSVKNTVLPLKSVIWIYSDGPAGWRPKRMGDGFYTLHIMTWDGRTHSFSHKKKEDLSYITDMFRLRNPEILCGLSNENRQKAGRLTASGGLRGRKMSRKTDRKTGA